MSEVFHCDDKDTLVAYLYGEVETDVRREVERHLRTCGACTREVEGLQGVRQDLQSWLTPETVLDFEIVPRSAPSMAPATVLTSSRWAALGEMPAWARVAAAALFIGVGLGVANVQVRSTSDGVVVTTGWAPPAAPSIAPAAAPAAALADAASRADDWRPAVAALEQSLRQEIAAQRGSMRLTMAPANSPGPDSAALLRRVRTMVDESEQRQRQEFATKLVLADSMWKVQRQSDFARFQSTLNSMQNRTLVVQANQQQISNQVQHLQRVNFVQPNQ